jgi:hypothetical protein
MEKRSRRRIRDLVAPAAFQGLSQNEIGCARISMMARSTNAPFKGRIQKRKTNHLQIITFGLQRTAGPYKGVESRCGAVALGRTYPLPPLSSGGALVVPPSLRFHIPLIEPDRRISRIRLSDKTSRFRVQRHLQLLNIYWS